VETAFAEADGGVEGGKATKADIEWRDGGPRPELPVLFFEDGHQGLGG